MVDEPDDDDKHDSPEEVGARQADGNSIDSFVIEDDDSESGHISARDFLKQTPKK